MQIHRLKCLCSKGPFPSYTEVLKLLEESEARKPSAMKKIIELRTLLGHTVKVKDKGDMTLWASVLHLIDKLAMSYFSNVKDHVREMYH